MRHVRYAIILFILLVNSFGLKSWIDPNGVPQKGPFHAYFGRSLDDLKNERPEQVNKAIKNKDKETFTKLVHDTDVLDVMCKLVAENNVEFLQALDDKFDYKLNFKEIYNVLPVENVNSVLVDIMKHDGVQVAEFLLEHGFGSEVDSKVEGKDKTLYELALHTGNAEFTKLFMQYQHKKNPKKIDSLAEVARGFVQAQCVTFFNEEKCKQSRDFFRMYVEEGRTLGIIDDTHILHSIAKDPTELIVLEDYIAFMQFLGISLDNLIDNDGNDLMHVTIEHKNKEGMQFVAPKMKQLKRENASQQTPGDVARSHLKVCEQHSIHPEIERRYREECRQLQKFYDAYMYELENNKKQKILEKEKQERLRIEQERKQLELEQQETKKRIEQEQLEYEQKVKQLEETHKKNQHEIEQLVIKKHDDVQQKEHTLEAQVYQRKELWGSQDDIGNK